MNLREEINFAGRNKSKVELNVAPLIDIVFLLLVFFMLASTFIRPESINLAIRGPSGSVEHSEEYILIHIGENNSIRLNGLVLTKENLKQELLARARPKEEKTITVQAEDNVSIQLLVEVMDEINEAGYTDIAISNR